MKGRDLLLLGAVLLVAGFAVADALRGDASRPRSESLETTRRTEEAETTRIRTVEGVRTGLLGGRLVYSAPETGCTIRELDLASGTVFPLPPLRSTCAIVSAPRGERVAFTLPSPRRDVMPYRVVDLNDPSVDEAGFRARNGSVVWSPDGQRLGWCEPSGRGRELELGRVPRTLPGCPIAYTPGGHAAFADGRRISIGGQFLLRAPGRIAHASFGLDGSLAIVDDDGRAFLYGTEPGHPFTLRRQTQLPIVLRGRPIVFSPTNCEAAVLLGDRATPVVSVVSLRDCPESNAPTSYRGHAVAWSPDGRWLAVAERDVITIHPVETTGPAIRLREAAVDLAWKS